MEEVLAEVRELRGEVAALTNALHQMLAAAERAAVVMSHADRRDPPDTAYVPDVPLGSRPA